MIKWANAPHKEASYVAKKFLANIARSFIDTHGGIELEDMALLRF